jgi:hypothetical protein
VLLLERSELLGGLFPARYAHLTEAFVANAPTRPRFVAALVDGAPGIPQRATAASPGNTGDAYPAPGATLGIGMTMGYIAGRNAAASLE